MIKSLIDARDAERRASVNQDLEGTEIKEISYEN